MDILRCIAKAKKQCSAKKQTLANTEGLPPPKLVFQGSSSLVFKPHSHVTDREDICYLRLFIRLANGKNIKVRTNDCSHDGSGVQMINNKDCVFHIVGLAPNELYMAALGAYDRHGVMIDGGLGAATRPILTAHQLPWPQLNCLLIQTSNKIKHADIQGEAFKDLWLHFVVEKEDLVTTKVVHWSLNHSTLASSSSILVRQFVDCVCLYVCSTAKELGLHSNCLIPKAESRAEQVQRVCLSRVLLVAMDAAASLNNPPMCLQTVVLVYGQLVPIVHWKINAKEVFEVLSRCLATLKEIASTVRQPTTDSASQGLLHMVTVISYFTAKYFLSADQPRRAIAALELCKGIYTTDRPVDSASTCITSPAPVMLNNAAMKKVARKTMAKKSRYLMAMKQGLMGSTEVHLDSDVPEFKCIETLLHVLRRTAGTAVSDANCELTGAEGPPTVLALASLLPPHIAHKEVIKFKRKAQYLEYFVTVARKALADCSYDSLLEWSCETYAWLNRRNDVMLNKAVATSKPPVKEEEKGTTLTVTEATTKVSKSDTKGNKQERQGAMVTFNNQDDVNTQSTNVKPADVNLNIIKDEKDHDTAKQKTKHNHAQRGKLLKTRRSSPITEEERKRLDATRLLQSLLPDYWKQTQRRRKFRAVSYNELPWRSQLSVLLAKAAGQSAVDLMHARFPHIDEYDDPSSLPYRWFSLAGCRTIMISWADCIYQEPTDARQKPIDKGGWTQHHHGNSHQHVKPVTLMSPSSDGYHGDGSHIFKSKHLHDIIGAIKKTLAHFRRSIVLAHRGRCWSLLQNNCGDMLHLVQQLHHLVHATQSSSGSREATLTMAELADVMWQPFSLASDCLLDMLMRLSATHLQETSHKRNHCDKAKFELYNDEHTRHLDEFCGGNMNSVIHLVMFTIELLYFGQRWEQLVDIATRMTHVTRDCHGETLLPLVTYAQYRLKERIGDQPQQPRIIFNKDTGIPIEVFLSKPIHLDLEPLQIMDVTSGGLYKPKIDGMRYSCVPLNINKTLLQLNTCLAQRPHHVRALGHCRQLLALYLAGQQQDSLSQKIRRGHSQVGFSAHEITPATVKPHNYDGETFKEAESIQRYPLVSDDLPTLICAYQDTISLLQDQGHRYLAVEAMHELGNIHLSTGKRRLAYKVWSAALDCLLKINDAPSYWQELLPSSAPLSNSRSIEQLNPLLLRCTAIGCLIGGLLSVKIARYIVPTDHDQCLRLCDMASAFFQAILCASLVHPRRHIDYISYDIMDLSNLVPGMSLVSDPHAVEFAAVTSSMLWLCRSLLDAGQQTQMLPLLALAMSFASESGNPRLFCRSVISRVECFSAMGQFDEAMRRFACIMTTCFPFHVNARHGNAKDLNLFNNGKLITDDCNQKALTSLVNCTLTKEQQHLYGASLCKEVACCQAHLATAIASSINALPEPLDLQCELPVYIPESSIDLTTANASQSKLTMSQFKLEMKRQQRLQAAETEKTRLLHPASSTSIAGGTKAGLLVSAVAWLDGLKEQGTWPRLAVDCTSILAWVAMQQLQASTAVLLHRRLLTQLHYVCERPSAENDDENEQPRQGIDSLSWLRCQKGLVVCHVTASMTFCGGIVMLGSQCCNVPGSADRAIKSALADCRSLSDGYAATATRAYEFISHVADTGDIKQLTSELTALLHDLNQRQPLPGESCLMQSELELLLADLTSLEPSGTGADINHLLSIYEKLQDDLLQWMRTFIPSWPNYPTSWLNHLVAIKLRIARCQFHLIIHSMPISNCLATVKEALILCQSTATPDNVLMLELIHLKAQLAVVQYRAGDTSLSSALCLLADTIRFSNDNHNNQRVLRQSYLEISLVVNTEIQRTNESPDHQQQPDVAVVTKTRQSREKEPDEVKMRSNALRMCSWLAVYSAATIAIAQRRVHQLSNEAMLASIDIPDDAMERLPRFVMEDLVNVNETSREKASGLTWLHLVKYLCRLQRQCAYVSQLSCATTNQIVARHSRLLSHVAIAKHQVIHRFLCDNLPKYRSECCPALPLQTLMQLAARVTNAGDHMPLQGCTGLPASGLASYDALPKSGSLDSLSIAGHMTIFQWYRPEFESLLPSNQSEGDTVLLAVSNEKSITQKTLASRSKLPSPFSRCAQMFGSRVEALHALLLELSHVVQGDVLPAQSQSSRFSVVIQTVGVAASSSTKRKRGGTTGPKSVGSGTQLKDEHVISVLHSNVEHIYKLFEREASEVVPCDASLANITSLERLFSASHGHMANTTEAFWSWLKDIVF